MLALRLNGEPIPGIHGGPVRLVTPGLFGTMQIKWLSRLRFETAESPNFYHATEYRVPYRLLQPGEKFKFTLENSRPTWDIKLMSYILSPEPGAKLEAGTVTISGVAYNDGKAPIETVLVSIDRGQELGAGGARGTREPLCLVRVEDRADAGARQLRDLGASHRLSRPQPTARRQDLLEPERLRVDRRIQGRRDRELTAELGPGPGARAPSSAPERAGMAGESPFRQPTADPCPKGGASDAFLNGNLTDPEVQSP